VSVPKPEFKLARVFDDGTSEAPEIVPVTALPWDVTADRRAFLGVGVAAATLLRALPAARAAGAAKDPHCLLAHREPIISLAVSPTGGLVASGGRKTSHSGTVKVWGLPEGALLAKLRKDDKSALALAITPDGQRLVVGSGGPIRRYGLPTLPPARTGRSGSGTCRTGRS
jgi:WD40 repeat protein